jgi:signal transduction histidine kinase
MVLLYLMRQVVLIHNNDKVSQLFKNIAGNDFRVIETRKSSEAKNLLPLADLVAVHSGSLREGLAELISEILSYDKSSFILVVSEETRPDLLEQLFKAGVKDIITLNTPAGIFSQKIKNLLDLKEKANAEKAVSPAPTQESHDIYRLIEAVKKIAPLVPFVENESALGTIADFYRDLLGVSKMLLIKEEKNIFSVASAAGFPDELVKNIFFPPSQGIMGYLVKNHCILRNDIPSHAPLYSEAAQEMERLGLSAFAPLMQDGRVAGALGVSRKTSGMDFTGGDYALLLAVSAELGKIMGGRTIEKKPAAAAGEAAPADAHGEQITQDLHSIGMKKDPHMDFLEMLAMRSSHELKNALVSIKTFTQLLPKKYKSESFRKDFFNVVGKEVDHLNSLIEEILFFAHPVDLHRAPKNISETVKSACAELAKEFKSITIDHFLESDSPPVAAYDEKYMKVAIHNLIKNSIESMKGQGTIVVTVRKTGESSPQHDPAFSVIITDSGEGIPDSIRQRVYEPFFTTKIKGLGLGLTITKKIMDAHGWSLRIESSAHGCNTIIAVPPGFAHEKPLFEKEDGNRLLKDRIPERDIRNFQNPEN